MFSFYSGKVLKSARKRSHNVANMLQGKLFGTATQCDHFKYTHLKWLDFLPKASERNSPHTE